MIDLSADTAANDLRELASSIDYKYRLAEFSITEIFGGWEQGYPLVGYTIALRVWDRGCLNYCIDDRGHRVKFKFNPKTIAKNLKKYAYTL